jgi:hypothetical protein
MIQTQPYTPRRAGFRARLFAWLNTHYGVLGVVLLVYFLSSFVSVTLPRYRPPQPGEWARKFDEQSWVLLSRPRVMRGDEMHYLLMANSLARDGDLRLSWDYANVLRGGLDMGWWHRWYAVRDPSIHFTRMNDVQQGQFSLIGKHPIGLSAVLALLLWPLAGTSWMEATSIWTTMLAAILALHFLLRVLELRLSWQQARNTTLLVAFATPFWSYARTLYTEVWIALGYLTVMYAVLHGRTGRTLPLLGVLAWFKYPALLMFLSAGVGEWLLRRRRNFFIVGFAGAAVLACIMLFNRWLYYRTGFMVFEGVLKVAHRGGLGAPIAWVPGKLGSNLLRIIKDADKGMLWFTPLLIFAVWGLVRMWRADRQLLLLVLACVLPWFALHVSYRYLMTGDSYSTRYLVPLVPMIMTGVPYWWQRGSGVFWRAVFVLAAAWSLAVNAIAGIVPAVSFSHTPFEMFRSIWKILCALLGCRMP